MNSLFLNDAPVNPPAENNAPVNPAVGLEVARNPPEVNPPEVSANEPSSLAITEENECIVCFAAPKNTMLLHTAKGAGHTCVCFGCAEELHKMKATCPICREPIDAVIRNYG